jgi:hypothetical protein
MLKDAFLQHPVPGCFPSASGARIPHSEWIDPIKFGGLRLFAEERDLERLVYEVEKARRVLRSVSTLRKLPVGSSRADTCMCCVPKVKCTELFCGYVSKGIVTAATIGASLLILGWGE